ncbi:hypothetical protein [Belnapia sp. F-4-1]|nr:hypothetical protein [Belnapia sp. F-4-1]
MSGHGWCADASQRRLLFQAIHDMAPMLERERRRSFHILPSAG